MVTMISSFAYLPLCPVMGEFLYHSNPKLCLEFVYSPAINALKCYVTEGTLCEWNKTNTSIIHVNWLAENDSLTCSNRSSVIQRTSSKQEYNIQMVKRIPGIRLWMTKWFTTNVFDIMYQCHLVFNWQFSYVMIGQTWKKNYGKSKKFK